MEVALALGGLGMIGAGAYMRAGRKNKGKTPILLIVFGIVAFLASFLMLFQWRGAQPPVPAGVKKAVNIVNAYVNNPSNMAKVALTVPVTGPPKVVVNPA